MNKQNVQDIEMLTRVVEFGAANVGLFPRNTFAGQAFAELGAALSKVSEHASLQLSSRNAVRASRTVREAARENLRKQLQRISDTASAIRTDTTVLSTQFRMPNRTREQDMIHGAKAFAEAAEPLKKAFIQHRLPGDFIESLSIAVVDLERAIEAHVSSKTRRAGARIGLKDGFATCQTLLKSVDAIVENTVRDNPGMMAEWNARRRVFRRASPTVTPEVPSSPPAA